ncbi:hypothetical protein HG531_004706 [Fusarium graminearum]|nr:hypothetical protein HG531_004706 [Fusarium graminearum]
MQFKLVSILALAGFAAAAPSSTQDFKNLPDGPYSGINNADGSSSRSLEKRDTHCWSYELDHGGVDAAVVQLKNWAGTGRDWKSDGTPSYFGYNERGVYVYYCINAPRSQGNLDVADINYALGQMDSKCKRYEAGYFRWDGSVEIVGKTRSGDNICLG